MFKCSKRVQLNIAAKRCVGEQNRRNFGPSGGGYPGEGCISSNSIGKCTHMFNSVQKSERAVIFHTVCAAVRTSRYTPQHSPPSLPPLSPGWDGLPERTVCLPNAQKVHPANFNAAVNLNDPLFNVSSRKAGQTSETL